MRQAGFTEQRLLPALCSGRITARRHSDPLWPAGSFSAEPLFFFSFFGTFITDWANFIGLTNEMDSLLIFF